jgi:hypothetical protein
MNDSGGSPPPAGADPELHELYKRWSAHARSGRLPTADELGVDEIFEKNPGAALIVVEEGDDGSRHYRYKRAGPAHRDALGRDIEGYRIDELVLPQQVAHFEEVYDKIIKEARPHYWMRMHALIGSNLHTFERLLVPVAKDGEKVDSLVGVWNWIDHHAA